MRFHKLRNFLPSEVPQLVRSKCNWNFLKSYWELYFKISKILAQTIFLFVKKYFSLDYSNGIQYIFTIACFNCKFTCNGDIHASRIYRRIRRNGGSKYRNANWMWYVAKKIKIPSAKYRQCNDHFEFLFKNEISDCCRLFESFYIIHLKAIEIWAFTL